MAVARNTRICIDSIEDIVLSKGGIVKSGIPLPSGAPHCVQQRLLVCRLEKLSSDYVEFR